MADFSDIKGVGKAGRKLLEAAGVRTLTDLADSDASALYGQLTAINRERRIARQAPPRKVVAAWIEAAEQLAATADASTAAGGESGDFADRETYEAALKRAPSARILYDEDGARVPPPGARSAPTTADRIAPIDEVAGKRPLDRSRMPTFDDLREGRVAVQPLGSTLGEAAPKPRPRPSPDGSAPPSLERPPARSSTSPARPGDEDQEAENRDQARGRGPAEEATFLPPDGPEEEADATTTEHTDAAAGSEPDDGSPESSAHLERLRLQRVHGRVGEDQKIVVPRWVRRGVSYPQPVKLYIGMLIVLASRLLFLAVAIGTPLVFLLRWLTGRDYVTGFIPVLIAFAVVGIVHLIVAAYFRCRICTCHFLFSRRCHKNKKAHRPFPLGWVGSTALHAILFRWFRCMYCGTAIQIGEQKRPSA